ncbi:hypothetical protein V4F39_02175 [Aquincola sp. MAHUQ-54]|uniref:Chromosome partition protein Smc n=1 Tax=Aquincola agrisoli TaxID=3119538 RepID=A0AAW9Q014_9BURK
MKRLSSLLFASLLFLPLVPAAQPAPGPNAQAPLLTRDQLRACMDRESRVEGGRADLAQRKAALDAQRAGIVELADELRGLKAEADAQQAAVARRNERMRALAGRIESFNERAGRPPADAAAREALLAEQAALKTESQALEADGPALKAAYEAAVEALNAKAQVHDERAGAWNGLQARLAADSRGLEEARQAWLRECADRRFREDDEKAIKAGR